MNSVNVVWFDRDQRTLDHPGLLEAQKRGPTIGIYIFNPKWLQEKPFGIAKMSDHRIQFLIESLKSLKVNLARYHIPLYVFKDDAVRAFRRLQTVFDIHSVYTMRYIGSEELDRIHTVQSACPDLNVFDYEGKPLIAAADLPFSIEQMPDVFTKFRRSIESAGIIPRKSLGDPRVQDDITTPLSDDMDSLMRLYPNNEHTLLEGGETAGLKRLDHYFFQTKKLKVYKLTRNQMDRLDDSSKLSPYLALGNLSATYVYEQILAFESTEGRTQSTYWLYFELLWRDFFHFLHMKYENRIFHWGGLYHKEYAIEHNPELITKWQEGKTGYPLVDANMMELKTTGWMSNRGRQNVASFYTKYLKQDWRIGAMWFESLLIDYDPASNYGNWLYQAGLGIDPRNNRIFDVIWQGEKYDPSTRYVRKWLPDFKRIPKAWRYQPMMMTIEQQKTYDFVLGRDYPEPIVAMPFIRSKKPFAKTTR